MAIKKSQLYASLWKSCDALRAQDIHKIVSVFAEPREVIQSRQVKETPDLVIKKRKYKMDLIPPALIVARYFADVQDVIEMLQTKQATAESELLSIAN